MDEPTNHRLVIGYGNECRGDDGAGPAVAQRIAALELDDVSTLSLHQLTPELAAPIAAARCVVFIDASCKPGTGVAIHRVEVDPSSDLMSHAVSPGVLLALSELLFGTAPPAWLVTIEGDDFSVGEGFSKTTAARIDDAIQLTLALLRAENTLRVA